MKVNTDGSVLNQHEAACGGIIRDQHGNYVPLLKLSNGACFMLEVGSLCSVMLCQGSCSKHHVCKSIGLSKLLMCFRKQTFCADTLAKHGHQFLALPSFLG